MKAPYALLLAALPAFAAQPSKNPPPNPATGSAASAGSATVILPLTVQATSEMSFGSVGSAAGCPQGGLVILASRSGGQARSASPCLTLNKNGGETPLIRTLSGQAGQSYRITVPLSVISQSGGLTVNAFTLYSNSSKDVTATKLAALDNKGSDSLRIGATLVMPFNTPAGTYTARVPVTLAYE